MLLLTLMACPPPDDLGPGPWNGGQTGSESVSCDDEEITNLGGAESAGTVAAAEGTWELTFTWDSDYSTELMTLTVTPTGDLLSVESEECGDREEFEADIEWSVESGAFDERFTAIVEKAVDLPDPVFEVWADLEPEGSFEGPVSFYTAFPEVGPTGTVTNDELVGRW